MKESILRETIRKEIRKSLKEADVTTGVERETSKIEKNAGVKMLKRALAQGSPRQQAAGLVKVIDAISGGSTAVKNALVMMLKQTDLNAAPEAAPQEPVAESNGEMTGALAGRQARLDKTQAFVQLKNVLAQKPALQQVDYVIQLINGLGLRDAAKKRLVIKLRQGIQ
jgi:hypothetical protein